MEEEKRAKYGNNACILHEDGTLEKVTRRDIADRQKNGTLAETSIPFDSEDEAKFYRDMLLDEYRRGVSIMIQTKPKYEVLPAFETEYGKKVKAVTYTPDFVVTYRAGEFHHQIAYDVKGFRDANGRFYIVRKMFEHRFPQVPLVVMMYRKKYGGWITEEQYKAFRKAEKPPRKKATK